MIPNRLRPVLGSEFVVMDTFLCLIGDELGSGAHRTVFAAAWCDDLVIKVETGNEGANAREWDVWHQLKNTPEAKWLCPAVCCSPGATALIMKRAKPITDISVLPKRLPWWATDAKPENWGLLDGRPVMIDYANHRFFRQGRGLTRRVKKWHPVKHADIATTPAAKLVARRRR